MPLCPQLKQQDVRDDFNKLLRRLGGKELSEEDVADRDAYIKGLEPAELNAYHRAFFHFDSHGGQFDSIGAHLDSLDRIKQKLTAPAETGAGTSASSKPNIIPETAGKTSETVGAGAVSAGAGGAGKPPEGGTPTVAAAAPEPEPEHHSEFQPRDTQGQFTGPPEGYQTTGIKHAVIEAERELRGLPIFQKARRSHGQSFDEGIAAVQRGQLFTLSDGTSRGDVRDLARDLATAQRARPLTTTESMALLYDRMRIQNALRGAERDFEAAEKSKDNEALGKATDEIGRLTDLLNWNDEADYRAGSEQGRGLAIRREMIRDDYSRARVMATARKFNKGKELPADIQERLNDLTEQIRKTNERLAQVEQERDEARAQLAQRESVKRFEKDRVKQVNQTGRRRPKEAIDADADALLARLAAITGGDLKVC